MFEPFVLVALGIMTGTLLGFAFLTFLAKQRLGRALALWLGRTSGSILNLLRGLGWQNYSESMFRAETGEVLERPFGTAHHFYSWDRLQFSPVYLTRAPHPADIPVETSVVLGPRAQKPLRLSIPILIGGMSYGGGLSLRAKIALARASSLAGTAANSGDGPFLPEERTESRQYILQYSRGFWAKAEQLLREVDMIEINLGQGAWGSAPVRLKGRKLTPDFAHRLGTIPGLDVLIEARLPEADSAAHWVGLVERLREATGGVPIAVKLGGTHYLERELTAILEAQVDAIVIDGAEGGTHTGPAILADDLGLPLLPSLCRASAYFERHGLAGSISLVAGGGLGTPGDFLKCLALGADAVYVGTMAILAMVHAQAGKVIPLEPPTDLVFYGGSAEDGYEPAAGAQRLANCLRSCVSEMAAVARALGKASLRDLGRADLVALDRDYARMAGVSCCGCASSLR